MNIAVGFLCPRCNKDRATVSAYIFKGRYLAGHTFHCLSCEHIWKEYLAWTKEDPT